MGILLALVSAFFSSSKDLVSKRLAASVDGTTSAFASFAFALPWYLLIMLLSALFGWEALRATDSAYLLVALRALTDTGAEITKMYALMHADVSLLSCVFALHPFFVVLISPLVTGDPFRTQDGVAIVSIVIGSLVLAYRPRRAGAGPLFNGQSRGVFIGVLSSVFFAMNSCLDRLAAQQSSPIFSGFTMTALSALYILPLMFFGRRWSALPTAVRPFTVRGIFETGFMVCKLAALQFLTAPKVLGIQKLSLLISIVGGRVVFKEGDFARRFIAGCFVFAGIVIIVFA